MKKYFYLILASLLFLVLHAKKLIAYERPLKADTTVHTSSTPSLFIPGDVASSAPNNLDAAFTPDGNTVYFVQAYKDKSPSIMFSKKDGNTWAAPQVAPFSVEGTMDIEPAFDPHGKYIIFASSRPTTKDGGKIDGYYNGKHFPGMGGNLWKVALTKKGWGEPEVLPVTINADSSVFSPAVTGDGSLYFMRADNGGIFHIYRSQIHNGKYETPVPANFTVKDFGDFDPAVAPDESFIIFSSPRAPAPKTTDLFICFRGAAGEWGQPIDLQTVLSDKVFGVEARLSPDCKTLYYTNSLNAEGVKVQGASFIWQVDISELLKAHGIDKIPSAKSK